MRGAAFPTSPSSIKARSRANCAPRWAIASTAATIALPSARGTSLRARDARPSSPRASVCARRDLPISPASTMRNSATLFSKTSIKRTGRDRFVRNVLIAIGNSGDVTLAVEAERLLDDRIAFGARRCGLGVVADYCHAENFCRHCSQRASRSGSQRCRRNGRRRSPKIPSLPRSSRSMSSGRESRWSPSLIRVSTTSSRENRDTSSTACLHGTSGSCTPCKMCTGQRVSISPAEQQMLPPIFDQTARNRIRLFTVRRWPQPDAVVLNLAFGLRRKTASTSALQ